MKSCKEIELEINKLKKKLKKKPPLDVSSSISEQQKCDSDTPHIMCTNCNCWKITREYCS